MNNNILEDYGYTPFFEDQVKQYSNDKKKLMPARIIEVHKELYETISVYGKRMAKLKGSLFYKEKEYVTYPTIGDFVLIEYNPLGEDMIYKVLERKSKFSRLDSWNGVEQIVAANFDYVFIMTSLNQDFSKQRIERYLTAAWQSGESPIIILTKKDLCEDYESIREAIETFAIGVPIIGVSSYTGEGIDEIGKAVNKQKTIVFLGSSGVGKSSLVNALAHKEMMKVSSIREEDSKGRHTTTHRQLIRLDEGMMLIDTPGMRELGMWDVSEGLGQAFEEIEELAKRCKFRDCKHQREPGCAIKEALDKGELSRERLNNYFKLEKEMEYARKKENIKKRLQESPKSRKK